MLFLKYIKRQNELIFHRSGLCFNTHLRIPNSPGTIDADYKDIVGVILENNYNIANLPYEIANNQKLLNNLREVSLKDYLKEMIMQIK